MDKLYVIKIGGNIIDDAEKLASFLKMFVAINSPKILVHGGGKLATRLAEQLGIPQQMQEGRRITDAETLKVVTMVYAGYINKNIVAQLQAEGCNAIGLTGADGNAIQAHKRENSNIDYGFAGDVDFVNVSFFEQLINANISVVVAPITHDKKGQLLNTNADTIAHKIATSLSNNFETHLIYCFEREGVLLNVEDETSVVKHLSANDYQFLKNSNAIFAGMLPKLDAAFAALESGVKSVVIGNGNKLNQLINGAAGTTITNDD